MPAGRISFVDEGIASLLLAVRRAKSRPMSSSERNAVERSPALLRRVSCWVRGHNGPHKNAVPETNASTCPARVHPVSLLWTSPSFEGPVILQAEVFQNLVLIEILRHVSPPGAPGERKLHGLSPGHSIAQN